jgi:hypothetical protein
MTQNEGKQQQKHNKTNKQHRKRKSLATLTQPRKPVLSNTDTTKKTSA